RGRPLLGVRHGGFAGRDAGVKSHWLTFAIDRAATGPDLRFPRLTGRRQRDGKMFPFHEVTTADMSPVFRSAAITERMQLVEQVIKTLVIDRAVRIVDPLGRGRDVKNGAGGISLGARRGGFDGGGCPR